MDNRDIPIRASVIEVMIDHSVKVYKVYVIHLISLLFVVPGNIC